MRRYRRTPLAHEPDVRLGIASAQKVRVGGSVVTGSAQFTSGCVVQRRSAERRPGGRRPRRQPLDKRRTVVVGKLARIERCESRGPPRYLRLVHRSSGRLERVEKQRHEIDRAAATQATRDQAITNAGILQSATPAST